MSLDQVQPIASLYRRGRGFAFETRPILGATPAELARAYGAALGMSEPNQASLMTAPTDYAYKRTELTIYFDGGRASYMICTIDYLHRADFGPIAVDLLRRELGPVRGSENKPDRRTWVSTVVSM